MLPVSKLGLLRSPLLLRTLRVVSERMSGVSCSRALSMTVACPHEEEFKESHVKLASLQEPRRDVKLQLYALYKQATVGECPTSKPDILDFDSHAKWDAWNQIRPMSADEAKKRYVELVNSVASGLCSKGGRSFYTRSASLQFAVLEDWSDDLKVSKHGHVIYIRFNRPAKKNALTLQMYDEVALTLENAAQDKDVCLVVFTGVGDYYCSGNDLNNLTSINPETIEEQIKEIKGIFKNFVQSFIDFPKPLIALVNGPAVGIAVSILGLFDAAYAVETATFQTPFMQLGMCPVGCSSYIFPRVMGSVKAGEMLLFNKKLTAQGALDRNLVSQVLSENIFHMETEALVARFATLPPQSLQVTKMLLRKAERAKLHEVNEFECESLLERLKSEECWNALMTLVNQRKELKMDDV